jgi:signal transduction histidine kinase
MANSQNLKQTISPEHAASRSPSPELPAILDRLVGLLAAATQDAPMMLFLHEPGANQYVLHQARGLEGANAAEPHFGLDSDLARWLAGREHPIYLAGRDDQPPSPLASLNVVLFIPMPARERVPGEPAEGWVALGPRPTGEPYSPGDLVILSALVDQAALAIENSRQLERIAALEGAKLEFIDFVAHELKQPMTAMQGYAKMLMMGIGGELSDRQTQFVQVINANVGRLARLVTNLLEISRLEAGRVKLQLEQIQPGALVDQALGAIQPEIESRQHSLEVDLPEDLPTCTGDRERLVQILTNLLSNACLYTPSGGAIRVSLSAQGPLDSSPGHLLFSVSDTGIGMSPEDIASLDKFFRADRDLVASQPGTGLGLAIVRHLVELHGGKLLIESELDQGSTFSFTLPLTPDDDSRSPGP